MKKLQSFLLQKELSILHDEFSSKTEKLLGDGLSEISIDGSVHTKKELCDWLRNKAPNSHWEISNFELYDLADGIALATYWAKMLMPKVSESNGALHSSIWVKNTKGAWQMVFHQATKVI